MRENIHNIGIWSHHGLTMETHPHPHWHWHAHIITKTKTLLTQLHPHPYLHSTSTVPWWRHPPAATIRSYNMNAPTIIISTLKQYAQHIHQYGCVILSTYSRCDNNQPEHIACTTTPTTATATTTTILPCNREQQQHQHQPHLLALIHHQLDSVLFHTNWLIHIKAMNTSLYTSTIITDHGIKGYRMRHLFTKSKTL